MSTDAQKTATGLTGSALLAQGAAVLSDLSERFDEASFERAVEILLTSDTTVATTGAGTSGIIARKIAATLTSTGTPAFFVHPSDALHGGLGLIGNQAVVLAVSNSGETDEILTLLPYLSGREVPIIALVGNGDSTLGRAAAAVLSVPIERELDPHDIVPTASVLGAVAPADALALAVMGRRGVTPSGFARNHPSGSLGRRLTLRLRDVVRTGDTLVAPDTSVLEVLQALSTSGKGAVGIGHDTTVEGLVTDGDIRRAFESYGSETLEKTAADLMTTNPITADAETMAADALRQMEEGPRILNTLLVVDGQRFVGLVRIHDLVQLGL